MIFISTFLLVYAVTKINEKLDQCRQSGSEVDDDHDNNFLPAMTDDDMSTATTEEEEMDEHEHELKDGQAGIPDMVHLCGPLVDTLLVKKTTTVSPKLPQSPAVVTEQSGCFTYFRFIPSVGPAMQRIGT